MKRELALALLIVLCAAALGFAVAWGATAATTGTNVSCATASTPAHTVGVDGAGVDTIPGDTATSCHTETYTVPTVTQTVTATTSTSTSTTTAAGTVVWKADATTPPEDEWASYHTTHHCAVVTAPGIVDDRAFETNDTTAPHGRTWRFLFVPESSGCYASGTDVGREEMGQANPGKTFSDGVNREWQPGEDRWISFEIKLDSTYPASGAGSASGWYVGGTLVQFEHPVGNGGPMEGLSAGGHEADGQWQVWGYTDPTCGNATQFHTELGSYAADRGVWVRFTAHIVFSRTSTGQFTLYSDFANPGVMTQVFSRPDAFTMCGTQNAMLTMGPYFHYSPTPAGADIAGMTVATTRAAAEANAFAQ